MTTDNTPNPAVVAPKLISLTALLAMAVGDIVLAGWAFDIAVLKSILPGWVSMKANTAVGFMLIGTALLFTTRPPATFKPQLATFFSRLARFCGLLAGLIGVLTLSEYIFGWNLGIDQWLVSEPAGTVGTSHPGRMAPETALCFVLLSAALWIIGDSRKTSRIIRASVSLGLLVTTLALAAMLSYATPVLGAYGWFGLTIMAMHTAILFALLGMAIIAASWQSEVLSWSLSRRTTAAIACGMALLVFIGLSTNRSQFWMNETNRQIAYSEEVVADIGDILIEVIDAQAHTRGYIITGDERFKASYLESVASSKAKLVGIRKLVASHPHQQQFFAQIEMHVNDELRWLQHAIDVERSDISAAARNNMVIQGEALLDSLRIEFSQAKSEHRQLVQQLKLDAESVSRFAYLTIFIGTLTSLLIFLVVIFRLNSVVGERMLKEKALLESDEELRKSNERFDLAVKGTNDGIWDWDIATNSNYFSPHFLELLGYGPGELAPELTTFEFLLHPEDRAWVFDRVRQHLEDKLPYNVEYRLRTKNGEYKWLQARGEVARDQSGKPFRMAGSITDITERKQTETAMNALIETSAAHAGTEFFRETVRSLCTWLGVDCAIISEVVEGEQVRALAMQLDGQAVEQYEYTLPGTPCENATQKGYCEYHEGVVQLFPADKDLVDMRAEAYIGTPIFDNDGKVIGILCALSRHKFVPPPMVKEVFNIIAARAGIEIKRKKAEEKIKEQLDYLERFRKVAVKREFRIKELTDATEKLKAELQGLKHG